VLLLCSSIGPPNSDANSSNHTRGLRLLKKTGFQEGLSSNTAIPSRKQHPGRVACGAHTVCVKKRAACSTQANEVKLYCFFLWRTTLSVSYDSSVKPKPPVQNKMTESRGKLLLEKQNVISRHAEPSRQRKHLKEKTYNLPHILCRNQQSSRVAANSLKSSGRYQNSFY